MEIKNVPTINGAQGVINLVDAYIECGWHSLTEESLKHALCEYIKRSDIKIIATSCFFDELKAEGSISSDKMSELRWHQNCIGNLLPNSQHLNRRHISLL